MKKQIISLITLVLVFVLLSGCSINETLDENRIIYSENSIVKLLNKASDKTVQSIIITTTEGHELLLMEKTQNQYQVNQIKYNDNSYVLYNLTERVNLIEDHGGLIGFEIEGEPFELELIPSESAEHNLPRLPNKELAFNLTDKNSNNIIENYHDLLK